MTLPGQTLFAPAATVQAVARARAVVVLLGSYDGSGNYGDIAQFEAALALVERLGPGVLALPLLEREYLAGHRDLTANAGVRAPHALFFDPDGGREDDLLPVAAPADLGFGASYLYGGGYLNRLWGARKLAMLEAAERLLEAGGPGAHLRLASGLQVEAAWLADDGAPALSRFDLLGARDEDSRRALATLGVDATVRTGDDAIGLLAQLPPPPAGAAEIATEGPLQLNLHYAEHDWMTGRPQAVLDFCAGFAAELGRRAGRPALVQPLIAYLDARVDERGAGERLAAACAEREVGVAEPLVLRPAGLDAATPELRQAALTVSCSYHVALTSLMLEVPALLIGDNDYYDQKSAGLAQDFGLPPCFAAGAATAPETKAAEVAAVLFGSGERPVRIALDSAAERVRLRRMDAERELLGRLGAGAAAALGRRLGDQAERLRERSAEPAELRERLSALESEVEQLRPRAEESPLDAELRVREAEAALAAIVGSRSWRLLAPLRRLGGPLRRLRHR